MAKGGILTYNNENRDALMKYSLGSYLKAEDVVVENHSEHKLNSLTRNFSLYEYTHGTKDGEMTDYSRKINEKYINKSEDTDNENLFADIQTDIAELWNGYTNYLDYIAYVYGEEYAILKFSEETLSSSTLGNVGDVLNSVGIPRNIQYYSATAKNYKDIIYDTRLGKIGSSILRQSLQNSANIDDEYRKRDDKNNGYITPELYSLYGVNSSTVNDIINDIDNNTESRMTNFDNILAEIGNKIFIIDESDNIEEEAIGYSKNIKDLPKDENFNYKYSLTNQYLKFTQAKDNKKSSFEDTSNTKISNAKNGEDFTTFIYDDGGEGIEDSVRDMYASLNGGTLSLRKKYTEETLGTNNILSKTNELFKKGYINTMLGRNSLLDNSDTSDPIISTVRDKKLGYSHGRSLKNASGDDFCRVWTWKKQYERFSDTIRNGEDFNIEEIQKRNKKYRAQFSEGKVKNEDGGEYLSSNSVLQKNGLVRITPKNSFKGKNKNMEHYMFSLENLAWKDVNKTKSSDLDAEQIGPNDGRIMWFPPYDISFQENVAVNWNPNSFIGRGEEVYTYTNTKRSGTLSFSMLIDHPSLINSPKNAEDEKVTLEEEDFLRFFAGCTNKLESGEPEMTEKETYEPNNITPIPGIDGNTMHISCYFPNDYSGYEDTEYTENSSEKGIYWVNYLMAGKGAKGTKNAKEGFIGYQMTNNTGISSGLTTGDTEWIMGKNHFYRYDKKIYGKKGERNEPVFENADNYRDIVNISDNTRNYSMLNGKEYSIGGGTYAFSSFIYLLHSINPNTLPMGDKHLQFVKEHSPEEQVKSETIEYLKTIFTDENISKITVQGIATSQGTSPDNTSLLAQARCESVTNLLKLFFNNDKIKKINEKVENFEKYQDDFNIKDINNNSSKIFRSTEIIITFNAPYAYDPVENKVIDITNTDKKKYIINNDGTYTITHIHSSSRYKNEYEFFNEIEINDPLLYKNITDKFKYFNPAFHSMSPEGFNARLTFLHQCTRQGHTISHSDVNTIASSAGNLAFGRMPVCVLRIGDFINTRILIENLSIQYDESGMQWDLNPEGAGVQPMFAKINLGIVILGGQSLEAPISRLQNAVSFNYYANTGVYDDRADRAYFDNNGLINYEYLYEVNYSPIDKSQNCGETVYDENAVSVETENRNKIIIVNDNIDKE